VNVLASGEVHHRIRAQADTPNHLFDLFGDPGSQRRVAEVAVDLHPEVAADDHRLRLGMIDVGRNDRAPASDLVTHVLGCNLIRNTHTPSVTTVLFQVAGPPIGFTHLSQAQVLAHGDELHLGRDLPGARITHLRDTSSGARAARRAQMFKTQMREFRIALARPTVRRTGAFQQIRVVACGNPWVAQRRQASQ
jgi:hypothetical protein